MAINGCRSSKASDATVTMNGYRRSRASDLRNSKPWLASKCCGTPQKTSAECTWPEGLLLLWSSWRFAFPSFSHLQSTENIRWKTLEANPSEGFISLEPIGRREIKLGQP